MTLYEYGKKGFVSSSPWLLGLIFVAWLAHEVDARITSAAYAYPRSVISYGLAPAKTDEAVISTVEMWKQDSWGAQIGALRVLCDNDRKFIDSLGGADTGARVCRIVK
ncbi:hypothetical protein QT13_01845 [Pectobacterium brasiliense]|nr:hypothetical protein QT13_01845 [Pectobacterium brasiliense]